MSNWELRPLLPEQLEYAVLDSLALCHVFDTFPGSYSQKSQFTAYHDCRTNFWEFLNFPHSTRVSCVTSSMRSRVKNLQNEHAYKCIVLHDYSADRWEFSRRSRVTSSTHSPVKILTIQLATLLNIYLITKLWVLRISAGIIGICTRYLQGNRNFLNSQICMHCVILWDLCFAVW